MARPYDTKLWKSITREVLARDNHRCQIRFPDICLGQAELPDHIIDWRHGGPWYDKANLRAACRPCNTARIHNPDPQPTPSRQW